MGGHHRLVAALVRSVCLENSVPLSLLFCLDGPNSLLVSVLCASVLWCLRYERKTSILFALSPLSIFEPAAQKTRLLQFFRR